MLVLSRKPSERILIGDDIVVTQLANGRIGIDAPKDMRILRGELEGRGSADGDSQRSEATTTDVENDSRSGTDAPVLEGHTA